MKNLRSVTALICLFALFSFGKKEADYSDILPGVVKVTDRLYYDKGELSNLSWCEYLFWLKETHGRKSNEYRDALPDTAAWHSIDSVQNPLSKLYLRHPLYRDYPVIGVTQTQAMKYCAWRTKRAEEVMIEKKKREKAPEKFLYRLPTLEEWKIVYEELAELPLEMTKAESRKCEGCSRYNLHKRERDTPNYVMKTEDFQITAQSVSYWPNQYGVYNVVGNVSEWVQEENTHVGGSWNTYEDEDPSIPQTLNSASSKVGFRCVCEILSDEA